MSCQLSEIQENALDLNEKDSKITPKFNINGQNNEKLSKEQIISYLTDITSDSVARDFSSDVLKETEPLKTRGKPPEIIFKPTPRQESDFMALQKWEGVVIKVFNDYFLAKLVDLTLEGADEEAEIPLEEISNDDRALVCPGAIFYWNIGYKNHSWGQRQRISLIRFRRLPVWQKSDLEYIENNNKTLIDLIGQ